MKKNKKKILANWKNSMASAVRDPLVLLEYLNLAAEESVEKWYYPVHFKMLVPLSYMERMKKGDWNDPLLRQVLPLQAEKVISDGFVVDPVGDLQAHVSSGVLHKYQGRVLLITTGACAVHCRYCFRQHFPYGDSVFDKKHWRETLEYLQSNDSINEVILSGGDPLMLTDDRLQQMCEAIAEIPYVSTIRFHTRIPVLLPERINVEFLSWLSNLEVQKVFVIHTNHANELDDQVGDVLKRLHQVDVTLLNQSVLLKGVNDDVASLRALSNKLFKFKVMPYYLHQLDHVQGAAHFKVEEVKAKALMQQLKNTLPGYLVPKYVKEVSGERSKQAIV